MKKPVWQMFLGRKAFVPHHPIYINDEAPIIEGDDLKAALEFPGLIDHISKLRPYKDYDTEQRLVIEDESGSEIRHDVPISFAKRQFTIRRVRTTFAKITGDEKNGTIS